MRVPHTVANKMILPKTMTSRPMQTGTVLPPGVRMPRIAQPAPLVGPLRDYTHLPTQLLLDLDHEEVGSSPDDQSHVRP